MQGAKIKHNTLFGKKTFRELGATYKEFFNDDTGIGADSFCEKDTIAKITKSLFKNVEIQEFVYKKDYSSLLDVIL